MVSVSRAINNKSGLSDQPRQLIIARAEEGDDQPNTFARNLATQQTTNIGLVVPDITDPSIARIAGGVKDAAFENPYTIFLVITNEDGNREVEVLDRLWQKSMDRVININSCQSEATL